MIRRPNGLLILLMMLSPLALAAGNIELPPAQAAEGGEESDNGEEGKDEGLPLEPSRNIRFETDEVTWMSLDLSPDGATIPCEASAAPT